MSQTEAATQAKDKGKGKDEGKRVRVAPVPVGFVDDIPPRTRNDFWVEQIAQLRDNPGKNFKYEVNSATSASYLKGKFGLITTTRTRDDGKVNLYVQYPGKEVGGEIVADEAKVMKIKETYGKNNGE